MLRKFVIIAKRPGNRKIMSLPAFLNAYILLTIEGMEILSDFIENSLSVEFSLRRILRPFG